MPDHFLSFTGEAKKVNDMIVENTLLLIAHNRSGFGSYVVLNNLPQWRSVVILFRNGAGIFSPKKFNGYENEKKKAPQYGHFRCGRVTVSSCLKKIGISFKIQPLLPKQEMEHDEIFEDTWEAPENERLPYVKINCFLFC